MSKKVIIPIFVSHKGCPNDCVFCNQDKITGQHRHSEVTQEELMLMREKIESYLPTIKRDAVDSVEVSFFGGSFTGLSIDDQNKYLSIAKGYLTSGLIDGIRLSTRPDCIDETILDNLKNHGVTVIELGVQSMDDKILSVAKRGHTSKDVIEASKLIQGYKFKLGLQMMIGLPNDLKENMVMTAKEFIKLSPDFVRIYPTLVIKNTKLEDLYNKSNYQPLTLTNAVDICSEIYLMFIKSSIKVIRVGLQPTKDLLSGEELIAGPFHPSFRQLVESQLFLNSMIKVVADCEIDELGMKIECHPKDISNVVGLNKTNKKTLKKLYAFSSIKIVGKSFIERGTYVIKNGRKEIVANVYE